MEATTKLKKTEPLYFVAVQWGKGFHYITHKDPLPLAKAMARYSSEKGKAYRKWLKKRGSVRPTIRLLKVAKEQVLVR